MTRAPIGFFYKKITHRRFYVYPKRPDGRKASARPHGWVLKPCKYCNELYSVSQMLKHIPRCEKNQNRRKTVIKFTPMENMAGIRAGAIASQKIDKKSKQLLWNYGIDYNAYAYLFNTQGGRCAICSQPPSGTGRQSGSLHVDHDHVTGKIRALLCNHCNVGLGALRDDPALLIAAAEYILRHRPPATVT